MSRTIRVGGVPEHFNLPWHLAIAEGRFAEVGIDVEWVDFPGGTGAIMAALESGDIDMATPLTEGAITAIANGNTSTLISVWVDSPLLWGVHTAGTSDARSIADVEGGRFAISRFGSGSELMSRVLAEDRGWTLTNESWVVVGGLDGALTALPEGKADVFLWNMSMTQPHVDDGTFQRVGVFPTPWPSFAIAASTTLVTNQPGLGETIAEVALSRAGELELDDGAAGIVAQRYGLEVRGALEWMTQVNWTAPGTPIDDQMITLVSKRMRQLGRITTKDEPTRTPLNPG